MKMGVLTGLAAALALALGGCATYDYVDRGGGYYTGSSPQSGYSSYGSVYGYGAYGGYGYGAPYGYRYRPGWSFGLDYGWPGYGYAPYPGGYIGGTYYPRPPYYRPHPQHPPHPPRPGDNDNDSGPRPERPPTADTGTPQLNRAPWRDIERLRRGEINGEPPPRRPRPAALGGGIDAGVGTGLGPQPQSYGDRIQARPQYPVGGMVEGGVRPRPPVDYSSPRPSSGPRYGGEGGEGGGQRMQQRPARTERPESPRPARTATRDTDEP